MALHGRDLDVERIDETLSAVETRRGRALFLTGEPGIGKSTMLAEARVRTNALVLGGAAWESGAAPSYWPWLQVLRAAAAEVGSRVCSLPGADRIASIVDGWGPSGSASPTLDPAAERFALLDAVVRALLALAAERPLVILLDDMHAADLPSLDLLVMLVREIPRAPIAVIAAWRDGELAVRVDAAQRLAKAARFGDVQPLRRLTAEEVAGWVGADGAAIFASTEGNPLFVEETLRARRGAVSPGVASVIADHLALASGPTRELLAMGAVLGREVDPHILAQLASEDSVEAALREAASVGIVDKTERGWRFRHVLLRDHLYGELPPTRRTALHTQIGEALEQVDLVRAAHHLLAGGSARAVEVARTAARCAMRVYAFEDAVELLTAAHRARGAAIDDDAIDLVLDLADARHMLGLTQLARADCVKGADLARARGDVERLARAAMVYASELTSGARDPTMIALLDEARSKLPASDSLTLARVLARLSAALVPGPQTEVERAQKLAREAVAMARRIGDPETTMFALRYATLAHSYQIPLREGFDMALEVVALSDEVGRPLEALDHRAWFVGANLGLGRFEAAQAALQDFEALVAPLPQPHYRWRAPVLRAAWATRSGAFIEAERHVAIARGLANEYDLDRAGWSSRFAALAIIAGTRDPARAEAFLDEIRRFGTPRIGAGAGNLIAFIAAIAGRNDEAQAELDRALFFPALIILQFGAEAMLMLRDHRHAGQILPMLELQSSRHPVVHGPQGGVFVRPSAMVLGEVYALLDRADDAVRKLDEGLALARSIHALPSIAQGSAALARVLDERNKPGDRARAVTLQADAIRIARTCGIHGIGGGVASTARRTYELAIRCADGRARIRWNGREIDVPITKGFEFLAALVDAPNREIHVADLVGEDDRGDAGDALDAKARAAYRDRARELQRELDEARERNDLGRADRLAAELEAITDELVAGTGLGGRARKMGSRVERARVNVQRRIKDSIKRLGAEDESLGRYLEATVRTGTFCSFVPLDS